MHLFQGYVFKEKKDGWIDNAGVKIIRILGKKMIKKVEFSTIDKILDDILKTLPRDISAQVKEMTCDDFVIKQHFGLGLLIKDKYFYRNKAREKLVTSLGNKKGYKFLDGDVFSQIVLEKLYERITAKSNG